MKKFKIGDILIYNNNASFTWIILSDPSDKYNIDCYIPEDKVFETTFISKHDKKIGECSKLLRILLDIKE